MDENEVWAGIEANGPLQAAPVFEPTWAEDAIWAERSAAQYDRRRSFIASYAWAVPTREVVQRIKTFVDSRRLLEVCAGNGLWARLLSTTGVKIVATDGQASTRPAYYPVELVEAQEAVRRHAGCMALLLCWPPFKDDCAFRALREFAGDRVIFVGDPRFTGDQRFHSLLQTSWELVEAVPLPSWPGISDKCHLLLRNKACTSSGPPLTS